MTDVYKFDVVVVDYDNLGEYGITYLLQNPKTTYTVLPYVFNTKVTHVDDPDSVGHRLSVKQKLPELFPEWLPITTAPRDGSRFLLWYTKEKRQYVVYFEELYEQIGDSIGSAGWELVDTYFVVDSPANHTERYIIEENKLADSYWQPLQTPPQL